MIFLQPSEPNTYADIEAAYQCLEKEYGVQEENVVLYGQSVGSGPTLDLATRLPKLRGVVLHSPILSGLRVMYPVKRTYWFDIYKVSFTSLSMLSHNQDIIVFIFCIVVGKLVPRLLQCKPLLAREVLHYFVSHSHPTLQGHAC